MTTQGLSARRVPAVTGADWWRRAGKTRDLPHAPQEAARAQTPRWGRPQGARMHHYLSSYAAADNRPEMNTVGSPAGSCTNVNMTGAQCMVRRPVPGKSIGLPLQMPSPGSKERHGCDEQAACSLVPRRERGHDENIDACNGRSSGADKACANAGGGQCPSYPHPPWTRQPSSKSAAERQTRPGTHIRATRAMSGAQGASRGSRMTANRGARLQHRKIMPGDVATPSEQVMCVDAKAKSGKLQTHLMPPKNRESRSCVHK